MLTHPRRRRATFGHTWQAIAHLLDRVRAVGFGMAVVSVVVLASPSEASKTRPVDVPADGGTHSEVNALLVRSYGSGDLLWPELNANWSAYGSIPVNVQRNDFFGVPITLDALEASGADVVILSDPAGIAKKFTADEISALQAYAAEGHELIGTFLVFYDVHRGHGVHNEHLAPLFGLTDQQGWFGGGSGGDTHTYARQGVANTRALFRRLPDPYNSTGYPGSQKPPDGRWSDNDLNGAALAGLCPTKPRCAITLYRGDAYDAIYVSNMPEYGGGTDDAQFLYNAITYSARTRSSAASRVTGRG